MLDTFTILKSRWQEVLLIVAIQVIAQVAIMRLAPADQNSGSMDNVTLSAMLYAGAFVSTKLLSLGFARTSFTDGPLCYHPWPLMKIGHHFFWRVVVFEVLVYVITVFIAMPFALVAKALFYPNAEITQELMFKLAPLCVAPALLIMARAFLFGPANILVSNAGLGEAYAWLRYFSIFRHPGLLLAYVVWIASSMVPTVLIAWQKQNWAMNSAIPCVIIVTLASVVLYVGAVKAAAQVYLAMQEPDGEKDSENKPEEEQA